MTLTVRVGRFLNRAEAEVARGFLEAQGIEARVLADDMAGVRPDVAYGYGGVTLAIHPDDADDARELLAQAEAPSGDPHVRRRGRFGTLVMLLLIVTIGLGLLLGTDSLRGLG